MPATKARPLKPKKLAQDVFVTRARIYNLTRKAATEYPDKRRELLEECEELQRRLDTELIPAAEKAAKALRKEIEKASVEYMNLRADYLALLGYEHDPGFGQANILHRVGDYNAGNGLREVLELPVAPDRFALSEVPQHQLDHEEKTRNERAGYGYVLDKDRGKDPLRDFGAGATMETFPDLAPDSGGA
jgi:hypothetical protein